VATAWRSTFEATEDRNKLDDVDKVQVTVNWRSPSGATDDRNTKQLDAYQSALPGDRLPG
jgi:hypothetical protein